MITVTHPNPLAAYYRETRIFEGATLPQLLLETVQQVPQQLAVADAGCRITYAELGAEVARFASGITSLAPRLTPGSVITFQLPNWTEALVVHHAAGALGAVSNPVVPIYRTRELGFILRQALSDVLVIPHTFRGYDFVGMAVSLCETATATPPLVVVTRAAGPLPAGFVSYEEVLREGEASANLRAATREGDPANPALLMYTSGTTSEPKGVIHTQETLLYEGRSRIHSTGLTRNDVIFMPAPVTHIGGLLYGIQLPVLLQAPVVLMDRWDAPQAIELIKEHGATYMAGATPFLAGLLEGYLTRSEKSSLRRIGCGGADIPASLIQSTAEVTGAIVTRTYGSTEFPTFCQGRADDPPEKLAATEGRPIFPAFGRVVSESGDTLPVGSVGELEVRGPECFAGYLDATLNEQAFSPEGYFRTGDLAVVDADGYITISGRKKDIIIRGGENISAKEVEDLLFENPLIAQVAVVGVPDTALGEKACAVVVLRPGAELPFQDMLRWLDQYGLAKQKYPELLEIWPDELPRTASGKVQKFRLREAIRRKLAGEAIGSA